MHTCSVLRTRAVSAVRVQGCVSIAGLEKQEVVSWSCCGEQDGALALMLPACFCWELPQLWGLQAEGFVLAPTVSAFRRWGR